MLRLGPSTPHSRAPSTFNRASKAKAAGHWFKVSRAIRIKYWEGFVNGCTFYRVEKPQRKHTPMIKSIFEGVVNLAKQAWQLPQLAAEAVKQRRQRLAVNLLEAERLDRIRNPSKYRGR